MILVVFASISAAKLIVMLVYDVYMQHLVQAKQMSVRSCV